MKKINIYSSLVLVFVFLLGACEDTNENLVAQRGVAVVPAISDVEPAFFTTDFDNTFIQFNVSLPEGESVDAAEIQATFKDKTATIQPISSFPATIKLPARDVMNKLGLNDNDVDVENNNEFSFYVVTTTNGVTTRSKTGAVKVLVTCEFDPELAVGSYHVVSSSWEVEGDVTFTADPDNPYKIYVSGLYEMEGGEPNDHVLELNISPTSFEVTGPTSKLGPETPWGTYTNYYYTPTQGIYRSCTGAFEMQFRITVDEGSFGTFNFIFTRN
ncbi:hypothetical protein PSM36_2971 [Proteiniphilum saccharofermentans]|uniref:Secreted protein n=1 Tax=Proteiniphilum saccharofermentans TaxID=1642647 RepID=A0A1R3T3J6_9BACT|nr:hypothetical protein [Proteiniphilum saccharofermentans]SCD21760.1 hypothetical protein PSM36_2971 [Proteiniphilum saccharofermentans]